MKMNRCLRAGLISLTAFCLTAIGCQKPAAPPSSETAAPAAKAMQIGGEDVITLKRQKTGDDSQPQFLSATVLPGRGMNLFQVTAYVPGKGEVNVLASPSLEEAAKVLTGTGDDETGNKSFSFGGAFLVPFANRIVGKVSADGKTITTEWHGIPMTLVANWKGKKPGATPHAIHGLILKSKATDVAASPLGDGEQVTGRIDAGDFDGHWFSKNDITITEQLSGKAVEASITVKNVGDKPEPVGIGWHPYFALPSGDRTQARLHVPGNLRTDVNNYDDVFATGRLLPVKGTPYDFTADGGRPLEKQFLDDNWTHLKRDADGSAVSEIIDPASKYGVRIVAVSPEISAVQVYAPLDKSFIALEPQFNLNDPFGKEWKGVDTKMVTLKPGESTTWKVRLEIFIPAAK
ncbi:MAG TPA: aldose 1-epimerase [Acidobacteriaceae bacterium]|nr:aldose 1-epimerase [Acidobacteriaceae bacterium]